VPENRPAADQPGDIGDVDAGRLDGFGRTAGSVNLPAQLGQPARELLDTDLS